MTLKLFVASGIFHPESGGPATYLYQLLPALQARYGWEIRALAYGDTAVAGYPYALTRIPRRSLPLRWIGYAAAALPLLRWSDVTYIHSLGLPLYGGKAPRVIKVVGDPAWERAVRRRWISPLEDIDTFQMRQYDLRVGLAKRWRRREVCAAEAVIVPSDYLRRMVIDWGARSSRVHVIYNALPPEAAPLALTQAEARAQLNLPDAPLILTAARLNPWKGVDHLLMALRAVPAAHLLIAGDGSELKTLRALAESLGVAARAHFLGALPREILTLYFRAVDYTALYSGYEGLSHVLLESLRAGTPVIASDKGGNPEVVRHDVNGLLVPYIEIEALAAALQTALSPGVRARLAANTQQGMERFDFARMVEATAAVLSGLVVQ